MAIPFKLNPEPPNQPPADPDPFLEFDSERPGVRTRIPSHESLLRPELPEHRSDFEASELSHGLGHPQHASAISPALAFAIGVAGLVTATVAYYQLSQVLSSRATPSQAASPSAAPMAQQRAAPPPPAGTGRVDVASNPPGALVSLNGEVRGVTPLILTGLPAGQHTIVVSRDSFSTTRTVDLGPGHATAISVAIPYSGEPSTSARTSPAQQRAIAGVGTGTEGPAGWLTIDVPIDLLVYQDGRLRGNTRDGRVTLPAGLYNVVLANTALEYREVISVRVPPGGSTRANVVLPTGYLSLNALPWADVWVDGNPVGTTPLANLSLPIGSHEVLWRHPTLGDRRQIVTVKAKTPARTGVEFTR